MTELNLLFEFSQGNNLDQVAQTLTDRITQLPMVEEVEAAPETMKLTGVELVAAIGVTILVVRSSRELIEEIRKLIAEIKGLAEDLQDLKNIYVDIDDERVPLDDLDDEYLRQLE